MFLFSLKLFISFLKTFRFVDFLSTLIVKDRATHYLDRERQGVTRRTQDVCSTLPVTLKYIFASSMMDICALNFNLKPDKTSELCTYNSVPVIFRKLIKLVKVVHIFFEKSSEQTTRSDLSPR